MGWLVGWLVGVPVMLINVTPSGQPALPVKRLCFASSTIAVVKPLLPNTLPSTVARLLPYSRVIVVRAEHELKASGSEGSSIGRGRVEVMVGIEVGVEKVKGEV